MRLREHFSCVCENISVVCESISVVCMRAFQYTVRNFPVEKKKNCKELAAGLPLCFCKINIFLLLLNLQFCSVNEKYSVKLLSLHFTIK